MSKRVHIRKRFAQHVDVLRQAAALPGGRTLPWILFAMTYGKPPPSQRLLWFSQPPEWCIERYRPLFYKRWTLSSRRRGGRQTAASNKQARAQRDTRILELEAEFIAGACRERQLNKRIASETKYSIDHVRKVRNRYKVNRRAESACASDGPRDNQKNKYG